jgi:CheY-like chemotaxis protein
MTRILIVEDEPVISMLLEEMLIDHGYEVIAIASTLVQAKALALSLDVDAALLDVNLGSEDVFPVAQLLAERNVPFAFTTGYGPAGLPPEWQSHPILSKPYDMQVLVDTLVALASPGTRTSDVHGPISIPTCCDRMVQKTLPI